MKHFAVNYGKFMLLALLNYPAISMAQSLSYFTPAISLGAVHDDNVFFTSSGKESDYFARISPELTAGYQSEQLEFEGLYAFDAEYYADNTQLNDEIIRQNALVNLQYESTRLLSLGLHGRYDATSTPGELQLQTGLDGGRNDAHRFTIGPDLTYQFNPLTQLALGYAFTNENASGEAEGDIHSVRAGIDREINQKNSIGLNYTYNHYRFDTTDTSDSHVPVLGWQYNFSARTSISLAAGPRFSNGTTSPEIAIGVQHAMVNGDLFAGYEKTESTVIGQVGTVDNDTISAGISYAFRPDLEFQLRPLFTALRQSGRKADVYQLALELDYRISDVISLTGSYNFSLQDGTLDDRVLGNIRRNVFLLSIRFSMPSKGNRPRSRLTR